ncbi:MAG: YcxB family protein [Candidatus Kapaibacterium sp.]
MMKKLIGWILILYGSFGLLMFGMTFLFAIVGYITNVPLLELEPSMQVATIVGIGIFCTICFLSLKKGLRLIKKVKQPEITPYSRQLNLQLSGRIDYSDYRNLILSISFNLKNWAIFIAFGTIYATGFYNYLSSEVKLLIPIGIIVFIFLIMGFTLRSIKKQYRDTAYLQHTMHYSLENTTLHIHGETFDSTIQWTHFTKVTETKKFFLFYQGRIATFIPKSMFSEIELIEFKSFINSLNISVT